MPGSVNGTIETAGSLISQILRKSIHAVMPAGFELKVFLFVLAYSIAVDDEPPRASRWAFY